jgi:hypothetical protein
VAAAAAARWQPWQQLGKDGGNNGKDDNNDGGKDDISPRKKLTNTLWGRGD